MAITLEKQDFFELVRILENIPRFRTVDKRVGFLDEIFYGEHRGDQIKANISVDGNPHAVAVDIIAYLRQFGQNKSGQESLGLLIKTMQTYTGEGAEGDFLQSMFNRYPLNVKPIAIRGIKEWRGHEDNDSVAEKVIGENTLRPIRFLQMALKASESVVKISGDEIGSGFLVGSGLIMTNHHVIASRNQADNAEIQFNYQRGIDNKPLNPISCFAKGGGLFYTSPRKDGLDFTIMEIASPPTRFDPVYLKGVRVNDGDRVSIIQHPGGRMKEFSMQNNFIAYADTNVVQYFTTTEPGSSGSPVFNDAFEVIAIHHSGGNLMEPGSTRKYLRNGGSSMVAILKDVKENAPELFNQLNMK